MTTALVGQAQHIKLYIQCKHPAWLMAHLIVLSHKIIRVEQLLLTHGVASVTSKNYKVNINFQYGLWTKIYK